VRVDLSYYLSVGLIALVYSFLSAEEDIVTDYKFNVYDLLVLPPSFPYGGMVCHLFVIDPKDLVPSMLGKCMLVILDAK